jgi:hypothetical protein
VAATPRRLIWPSSAERSIGRWRRSSRLAAALRRYHADVDEVVVEPEPDAAAITAVRERALAADLVVIGMIDAHRLQSQLALVDAVAETGTPTIAVALRGPWDVAPYRRGVTSLAAVLVGDASASSRIPVAIESAIPAA